MKKILFSTLLLTSFGAFAQNVYVPDPTFKNYLVNFTTADSHGVGEISVSEAFGFNGFMNLAGMTISDLTGIEAFGTLGYINCSGTDITSLNVSTCYDLVELVSDNCTSCKYLY